MQRNITRNEVLAIIETYEGVLRQDMTNREALERWTHWKCELARLEGR
ncbi:MAG TPA: hypothetical protein VFZ61_33025 [Polyangiales bacterium]